MPFLFTKNVYSINAMRGNRWKNGYAFWSISPHTKIPTFLLLSSLLPSSLLFFLWFVRCFSISLPLTCPLQQSNSVQVFPLQKHHQVEWCFFIPFCTFVYCSAYRNVCFILSTGRRERKTLFFLNCLWCVCRWCVLYYHWTLANCVGIPRIIILQLTKK